MHNPHPKQRSEHRGQTPLELQDRAPAFAPRDPNDWTREAEPAPRQPLNGHQPELFPRRPAKAAHA